ncbi:MAG: shikimate dehydrogenase [Rhodobiaceae bacterium]|nr:shikimate dehydrogenase [Rhodobiaceae bacterium]RPF97482.1 MAG: shikimate dehydrogenase [Rhizobiales bacterium TMED227]
MNTKKINDFKLGVLGYPLSHTLSPNIHNYWLSNYKLNGIYEKVEVSPKDLKDFFSNNIMQYRGLNVTIPHKVDVFNYMDEVSDSAKVIGAINCITLSDNKLIGSNTDSDGFMQGLTNAYSSINFENKNALVIGAGGASRAIIHSLQMKSVRNISVTNRSQDRLQSLKQIFGNKISVIDWGSIYEQIKNFNLIINCTSLGMLGKDEINIDLSHQKEKSLVIDLVYNPLETRLIVEARKNYHDYLNGIPMLLNQAALSWVRWLAINPRITDELISNISNSIT